MSPYIRRSLLASAAAGIAINIVSHALGQSEILPAAVVGIDQASNSAYSGGWSDGSNGGLGFGAWALRTTTTGGGFAGFYRDTSNGDDQIRVGGSAWSMYANGGAGALQEATAFRGLGSALTIGQAIRLTFDNSSSIPGASPSGSVGFTLRNGNANSGASDYNNGARTEFSFIGGDSNYSIFDSVNSQNATGIGFTSSGLRANFVLTGANTYNLFVRDLLSGAVTSFIGRTLGGTSGSTIDSIALFDRNRGSVPDSYFNSLAVIGGGGLTWNGLSPSTDDQSDARNWHGDVAPVDGDTVTFGGLTNTAVDLDQIRAIQQLRFTPDGFGFVLSTPGNASVDIANGLVDRSGSGNVIEHPVRLLADSFFDVFVSLDVQSPVDLNGKRLTTSSSGLAAFNGISGAGTLELVGESTQVTFSGTNSFTGQVHFRGGQYNVGTFVDTSGGFASVSRFVMSGNATVTIDSTFGVADKLASVPIDSSGGTIQYLGPSSGGTSTEATGALNMLSGATKVRVAHITPTVGANTVLSFSGNSRSTGSNGDFQAPSGGPLVDLGAQGPSIVITGLSNTNGILGGWATVGGDWARVSASNVILPFTTYAPLITTSNSATTNYVHSSGSSVSLAQNSTLNSLKLSGTSSVVTSGVVGRTLVLSSGGILNTGSNTIQGGGNLLVSPSGTELFLNSANSSTLSITARINSGAPAFSVIKTGGGTVLLAGAGANTNGYTGATYINDGTLRISTTEAIPSATSSYILNGGTLALAASPGGGSYTTPMTLRGGAVAAITSTRTWNGTITVDSAVGTKVYLLTASGDLNLGDAANDLTGGGGNATLSAIGSGRVLLQQSSDYSGTWEVHSGVLRLGVSGALGATTNKVTMPVSGELQLNGNSTTIASLSGTGGTVSNYPSATPATLTINQTSPIETFGGDISDDGGHGGSPGALSVVKSGTGALWTTGSWTNSGPITINGGTLVVNGTVDTSAQPLTINSGGALAGIGSVARNVTVNTGGTLAPGTESVAGSISVDSLTLSGGVFEATLNGSTDPDFTFVTVAAASSAVSGTGKLSVVLGYAPAPNTKYQIMRSTGGFNIPSGIFTNLAGNMVNATYEGTTYGFVVEFDDSGAPNDVFLYYQVPEPALLPAAGLLVVLLRRRTRR